MNISFITIILGYLIGTISPAYFLGKVLRGIDIRKHGDGNAGGVNAYHVLGLIPAVITVIIDISKGLISMYIASLIGASPILIQLAGIAAVVGHVFPFYLNFKGGKGIGTSLGILLYYVYVMLKSQWLPFYWLIVYVLGIALLFFITRKKELVGLVSLPLLLVLIFLSSPLNLITTFAGIIIIYIFCMNFFLNIFRKKPVKQE